MSENPAGRKPGQRNESVHDRLIREAQERGGFDNLKGAGKPLRHLTGPGARDWVTQWVQREDLSGVLPPELALRKEAEKIVDTCADLPTEAEVRSVVDELNRRIREMRLRPPLVTTAGRTRSCGR
ncbi:DUF1992 domain-containing protein [Microlunatus endophyticus]